jgi:hypothetical protein
MAPELTAAPTAAEQIQSTFASTSDLLEAPSRAARHKIHAATLSELLTAFHVIERDDINLREIADGISEVEYVRQEAAQEERARATIALTGACVDLAKRLEMPESSYAEVAEVARELNMALEWTDEDYAKSEVFNRLLREAIAEHEAGRTVEGGFGE